MKNVPLYPLLLQSVFKDYIWGGERLKSDFGKVTELSPLAESWELACHKDGVNIIKNGEFKGWTLDKFLKKHPEVLGTKADSDDLPILVKLIDARYDLSVQVHPDEEYAHRVESQHGKTEMWYILDCEPGASIIYGLKNKTTREELRQSISNNTLMDIVNRVPVKKGDVFFIEAGTLHAIGKGIVIAEIQQNSNVTYRVYDYGRIGKDGKPRQLHIDKAIDVVELKMFPVKSTDRRTLKKEGCRESILQSCGHFTAKLIEVDKTASFTANLESFTHALCVEGIGVVEFNGDRLPIKKGDSLFLPAGPVDYFVYGNLSLITTTL